MRRRRDNARPDHTAGSTKVYAKPGGIGNLLPRRGIVHRWQFKCIEPPPGRQIGRDNLRSVRYGHLVGFIYSTLRPMGGFGGAWYGKQHQNHRHARHH